MPATKRDYFVKFFPLAWESDLKRHPLEIEGAWISICCQLWPRYGVDSATWEQWANILRVPIEAAKPIIRYIGDMKIGNVNVTSHTDGHDVVTIMSRRIKDDMAKRKADRDRQRRHRDRKSGKQSRNDNGDVTDPVTDLSQTEVRSYKLELDNNGPKKDHSSAEDPPTPKPKPPKCPHQDIILLYHDTLPELNRIHVWDDTAEGYLRARWREDPERQFLSWWKAFFIYVKESAFLKGEVRNWQADLRWLVKPSNFAKVMNGAYHTGKRPFSAAIDFIQEGDDDISP